MVELNNATFWLACALGVVMLVLVRSPTPRKWLLALLNLAFLAVLLGWRSVGLAGGILIAYLLLQAVGRARGARLFLAAAGVAMFGLFLLHKLPQLTTDLRLGVLGQALSVIGYSYVALRMVEVLRAVFERRHKAPDLPSMINYLLPFHMLAAGPIQAYDDFVRQPALPAVRTARDVLVGIERITGGLFKKFVLAFVLQKAFLTNFTASGPYLLIEVQVFFVWLYLDFSAYSDIAVGTGALIGVATPENFNRPLIARNVIDFWERWHMSLSLFIRRNLFIPIQMFLMRRNDAATPLLSAIVAIAVSFVLCGLWHGLTLGFLIWGTAQAAGLVVVRVYGQVLQDRLGKKAVKAYLANPWITGVAMLVTFEFEACTQIALFLK